MAYWISARSYIHKYSEFPPKSAVEAILQPHDKAIWARIAEEIVVLIVEETTKLYLSKHMALTSDQQILAVLAARAEAKRWPGSLDAIDY